MTIQQGSRPGRALMIQGTGSNVGKSLLVAGLCRAARLRGLSVLPFKPQNMSNNAAITADGGLIGRAQALQALACGAAPMADMNPVLLRPQSETGSEVIVQGRRVTSLRARDYAALKPRLADAVMESFTRLKAAADLVIVEGAGSPAEINLRAGDIANMGFARHADLPVILVGDIDRGGVIAQIIGTQAVLDPADNAMIAGFLVNRFRGDPRLFDDGYRLIEARSGWRGFGLVPWFSEAVRLPAEDALDLAERGRGRHAEGEGFRLACLALPRIADLDDLDPLGAEPGLTVAMIQPGQAIPGDIDLVILPGSRALRADLAFLRAEGWDIDLKAHHRRGGRILGLGRGMAMLGREIHDPEGVEAEAGDYPGLGFLDVVTRLHPEHAPTSITARHAKSGQVFQGYQTRFDRLEGPDCTRPFAWISEIAEGACSPDGRVEGTGLQGFFGNDRLRGSWIEGLGAVPSDICHSQEVDAVLDRLAAHLEAHIAVDAVLGIAR